MEIFGALPATTGSTVTVRRETTPPGRPPKKTSSAWTAATPPATVPGLVGLPQALSSWTLRALARPQAPTTVVRLEINVASCGLAARAASRAVFAAAKFAGVDVPSAASAADSAAGLAETA